MTGRKSDHRGKSATAIGILRIVFLAALIAAVCGLGIWYLSQSLVGERMQAELDARWEELPQTDGRRPSFRPGDIVGRIMIPRIGLDAVMVEMADVDDKENLDKGPAHLMGTALPGEEGNCVIAGHRTTYSRPFYELDHLEVGDEVILNDIFGESFSYMITRVMIVGPEDVWVMDPTPNAAVTLIACHPPFSARNRIVVRGEMAHQPGDNGS
ncbi:MAG: sortase [Actinomycetota bacterium]